MDPDEALRKIRKYVSDTPNDGLQEQFEALDEWLTNGGFLPKDWSSKVCDLCPHAEDYDHRD